MSTIEDSNLSLKSVAIIVVGAVSLTATVSSVYHGIVYNAERVEYVNERIDKKTGRNEDAIRALENRVEKLELLNPEDDAE